MENTRRRTTLILLLMIIVAPILLALLCSALGIMSTFGDAFMSILPITLVVFGLLAYLSHTSGKPRTETQAPVVPTSGSASLQSGPTHAGLAILGGLAGFAVGYLTRPMIPLAGERVPMALLTESVPPQFATLQSEFQMHMLIATGLGFIAVIVLLKVLASVKPA